ncbi:MAG TPA: potassium channel family protein [Gaiellaceae bacterium]|nr:potassium channel family protein [Gaiellaceae bacterium]
MSKISARADRAVREGRILRFLTVAVFAIAIATGALMTIVDKDGFPTVGTGVWWAVVTFCTVGYGDVVPTTPLGKSVAAVVMVLGIMFISLLTAIVTSAYIDRARAEREAAEEAVEQAMLDTLRQIEGRIAALERRLG